MRPLGPGELAAVAGGSALISGEALSATQFPNVQIALGANGESESEGVVDDGVIIPYEEEDTDIAA